MEISPSVYEHAAALIGRSPWEVSRDEELLYAAHAEAFRVYRHTPIMPGIDIYNLEAEAYGGVVENPGGLGIPAISKPICPSVADLLELKPLNPRTDGRIPMAIRAAARLAREFPETQVRVPVSGPFSIASNLVGFENLLYDVAVNPESVARLSCIWLLDRLRLPRRSKSTVSMWPFSSQRPALHCCRRPVSAVWSCRH